ncbi:MAG TPA: TraR/DksA family transcriptional regulator [Anaeromyxobacter sp.]
MASALTRTQLAELRRRLEEERTRIVRVLSTSDAIHSTEEDRGPEIEEVAQRAAERDQAVGVLERERALLAEVDRALAKIDRGEYGQSERTGAPIPYARLAAVPWAREDVDE